ncbi:MAG: hypothetical protein ACE5EG_02915 [Thermoanaerobaculia bacterium]
MSPENLELVTLGADIGLAVAILGALVEYRLSFAKTETPERPRTPWIMLVGGLLCFLGLVATLLSLLVTSSLLPAVCMGIGVGVGFYSGFVLLLLYWLIVERTRTERPLQPDQLRPRPAGDSRRDDRQ